MTGRGCLGDGKRALRPAKAGVLRADGTGNPRRPGTDRRHPETGLHRSVRAGRRRGRPRPGRRRRLRDPQQAGCAHSGAAKADQIATRERRGGSGGRWPDFAGTGAQKRSRRKPCTKPSPNSGTSDGTSPTGVPHLSPAVTHVPPDKPPTKPSTPSSRPSPGSGESRPTRPAEAAAIPAPPLPTTPRTSPVPGPRPPPRRHDKDRLPIAEKTASDLRLQKSGRQDLNLRPLDPQLQSH